jgi:hypothetical protein
MRQVRPHARAWRFQPLRAPPLRRYILLAKRSPACVNLSWSADPGDRPFSNIRIGNSTNLGLVGHAMFAARLSDGGVAPDRQTPEDVVGRVPALPQYELSPGAAEDEPVWGCASTTANTDN